MGFESSNASARAPNSPAAVSLLFIVAESPLALLDKATVLQECRVFNDAQFVQQHPKRCCMQLTKLLFLLSQGERFSGAEADDVFFGVTKLFQSSDVRIVLLARSYIL